MISKCEVIGVVTTALMIVASVFLAVWLTEPDTIFRGYPSEEDINLPVITLDELSKYNGFDHPKILIALKNIVFDVSASEYYKEGYAYSVFAGRDCSLMLAKWKAEERFANLYNTPFYDALTADERSSLDSTYEETYSKKYPKVARI